jgi:hypothetical protein
MTLGRTWCVGLIALAASVRTLVWAADLGTVGAAETDAPAITRQQIEADWLRQDELRRSSGQAPSASSVTVAQDAAGGCDGVKTGKWGFHTENESDPWWQVNLGKPTAIDRVVLYNRCDSCGERNTRILVLLSSDGRQFTQAYRHDGTMFYGHPDGKPLVVPLGGAAAQYVRLALKGTSYFHLDEVEVYAAENEQNVALGKPATQSSTSQWSATHNVVVAPGDREYPVALVIQRGRRLAEALERMGGDSSLHAQALADCAERLAKLPADASADLQREIYFQARWAVRRLALSNPLLDFNTILFAKRSPPLFPHMSDQYYGWWSRPGGGIWIIEGFQGDQPQLRCLTDDWPDGTFLRPDLSYDGRKVLFAYCRYYPHVAGMDKMDKQKLPGDCFFNLYEMNVDGSDMRRVTRGRYDDFDARYLPNGEIVFLSTRKGQSIQVNKASAAASCEADLPDSYVRCGGGNTRPVAVFTLHAVDADGSNMRAISAFENFEWTPSVARDGRILYARWDYIDRHNGPFMSLWSTNPDGTNPQLVYGNFTVRPQCVFEARPVPGSEKLVFTAAAHHSNMGGSLVLLDRRYGTEELRPLTRLTPEVCFPETEGWPDHFYANPYPLSEQFFLVSWSDHRLPPHSRLDPDDQRNPANAQGIYLYDVFGNLELLYRDPQISAMYPLPVGSRSRPPNLPHTTDWDGARHGAFLVQDIYQGMGDLQRGTIQGLRIIAVPPKVQPHMNNPVLGVSREDPGKFVLGTAPVEPDGSAHFLVPSGVPVLFQALDAEGMAVRTMRSLTYVQPGQTLACIGCHESREISPPAANAPLAALREPSRLTPAPDGAWPLRFDELVQPVLDAKCVRCHKPGGEDTEAARFDLTAQAAYQNLISYGGEDLKKLAFERPRSEVGDCPARQSKLLALLRDESGHHDVKLDPAEWDRLVTWMDTYAHILGSFSPQQEEQLRRLREQWADLLVGN